MREKKNSGKKKEDLGNKKEKRRRRRRRRRITLLVLLGILVALFGYTAYKVLPLYREAKESMYDVLSNMDETTFKRAGNTVIYDKDDNVIGKIGNEKYEYVDITDISEYIQKGYIAKEDRNFTSHIGVDLKAIARAGIAYIKNHGTITQGGSTITQQVAKNNLLSSEQTFGRKVLEALVSLELEKEYPKTKIMEFYCNSNYFGNGCYGVEGASQYYFGKSASDVTLAEAAVLVATSNSPNNYNPVADYELSMEKKADVLDDMLECGYITQEEHDAAVAEEPAIVQKSENVENENYMITYAIHCAALNVMELDGFEFQYVFKDSESYETYETSYETAYADAVETVRTGGYEIHTSFDTSAQEKLQAAVDEKLSEFTETGDDGIYELQGAAVCIDNSTGLVCAIVGGREGAGSFNRGYQAERQPGSVIKPLLDYGPAINEGVVSPASVYTDEEITINGYSPKNSGDSYHGDVTIREALARSLNTIAVQLYFDTGRDTCLSYLEKLQFSTMDYSDYASATVSIGGFNRGVTVDAVARGYFTLENGGFYTGGTCIRSLSDYKDGTVYEYDPSSGEQVYSEDTAFMITDMLEGVFNESYGTAHAYYTDSQVYAGKTGTTNDSKDAWFCGYSAYYTTAVWMGYDTPQEMDGVYGGTYPAEIWKSFMDSMHGELEKQEFDMPGSLLLMNSNGTTKSPAYTSNIYNSRPTGWDYISGDLKKQEQEAEKEREQKKLDEAAEEAVGEFEDFQIDSAEDALAFDEMYYEVLDAVNKVADTSTKSALTLRATNKYNLLSTDVKQNWEDAQEIADAAEQEKTDTENELAAQESLEAARETQKQERVDLVEWYIEKLDERTSYSSYVESMISKADAALEACIEYDEYEDLKTRLTEAEERVENLDETAVINSGGDDEDGEDVEENRGTGSSGNTGNNSSGSSSNPSSSRVEVTIP